MDHLGLFVTLVVLAPIMLWIGWDRQAPKRPRQAVRKPVLSNDRHLTIESDASPAFN